MFIRNDIYGIWIFLSNIEWNTIICSNFAFCHSNLNDDDCIWFRGPVSVVKILISNEFDISIQVAMCTIIMQWNLVFDGKSGKFGNEKCLAMDVVSLCSYKRQSTMYKHTTNEDIWSENAFYHKSAEAKMWTSEKLTIVHCTCRSCRSIWAYGIRNWWIVLINTRVRNKNILVLFSMLWNFPKWKFLILVWSSLVHY